LNAIVALDRYVFTKYESDSLEKHKNKLEKPTKKKEEN
jgi:hypothetical protein